MIKNNLYKNCSIPTYFGIGIKYLDINALTYRMFGAVWQLHNGYRYIIGYWFGDNKKDLISHINCEEWTNLINQDGQIQDVYQAIREEQEREFWEKRFKLSNKINYQENWKASYW